MDFYLVILINSEDMFIYALDAAQWVVFQHADGDFMQCIERVQVDSTIQSFDTFRELFEECISTGRKIADEVQGVAY